MGSIRIIGGDWRRSRLEVPDLPGLRPTHDRIRETVFNWLAGRVEGSRCLDLFAGSGALGFEAASRGAARVVLLDSEALAVEAMRSAASRLGGVQLDIRQSDAARYLASAPPEFDIVFLDPPFDAAAHSVHARYLELLRASTVLHADSLVYVEAPAGTQALHPAPASWQLERERSTRSVRYYLARPVFLERAGSAPA